VLFLGWAVIIPTVWALWHTLAALWGGRISLFGCLLLANAVVIPFVPFSTFREYLAILRFIPGLVLLVILYSAEQNQHRPLRYSTFWLVLLSFITIG